MDAVRDGAARTVAKNGLLFVAALFLLNLGGAFLGLRYTAADGAFMGSTGNPFATGVLGAVFTLVSLAVSIIAIRTFVGDETETVPDEHVRRNMGPAMLHMIVGGIIFAIVVLAGLALLIVPGVYLLLGLFFWSVRVAVEDESFVEAMQQSWNLTAGHKWELFGLLLVLVAANIIVGGLTLAAGPRSMTGIIVGQVLSAFVGVFVLAAQARAYVQLTS